MAERKPEWQEAGDLAKATARSVKDCGAYAKLDQYNEISLLSVYHIFSSCFGSIYVFACEGQSNAQYLMGKAL